MKKFILILSVVLCMCACKPLTRCEYSCTVKYELDGSLKTETVVLKMANACTPTTVLNGNGLMVVGYPSNYWHERAIIYCGSLPVKVVDFEYRLIRKYKISSLDGHEITKK